MHELLFVQQDNFTVKTAHFVAETVHSPSSLALPSSGRRLCRPVCRPRRLSSLLPVRRRGPKKKTLEIHKKIKADLHHERTSRSRSTGCCDFLSVENCTLPIYDHFFVLTRVAGKSCSPFSRANVMAAKHDMKLGQ